MEFQRIVCVTYVKFQSAKKRNFSSCTLIRACPNMTVSCFPLISSTIPIRLVWINWTWEPNLIRSCSYFSARCTSFLVGFWLAVGRTVFFLICCLDFSILRYCVSSWKSAVFTSFFLEVALNFSINASIFLPAWSCLWLVSCTCVTCVCLYWSFWISSSCWTLERSAAFAASAKRLFWASSWLRSFCKLLKSVSSRTFCWLSRCLASKMSCFEIPLSCATSKVKELPGCPKENW